MWRRRGPPDPLARGPRLSWRHKSREYRNLFWVFPHWRSFFRHKAVLWIRRMRSESNFVANCRTGGGVSRPFANASECRWYRHANCRTRRALHHRGCPCSRNSGLCNQLTGKSVGSLPVLLIVPDYLMVDKLILELYVTMLSVTPEYNVERLDDNNEMVWKGTGLLCPTICWMDWGNSRHCRSKSPKGNVNP